MERFGANKAADIILNRLPRRRPVAPNAFVYIDAAGDLVIMVDDVDTLIIYEDDLYKVHGDR